MTLAAQGEALWARRGRHGAKFGSRQGESCIKLEEQIFRKPGEGVWSDTLPMVCDIVGVVFFLRDGIN